MDLWDNYTEDQFVEFHIFIDNNKFNSENDLICIKNKLLNYIKPYLSNYIWYNDIFDINIWKKTNKTKEKRKKNKNILEDAKDHLYNRIYIGECIEDEWFILFLLYQISNNKELQKKYNFIITIHDNDGEFLLIEAAYELPKWISKPKHSINRVFIYNGDLHILPRCLSVDDPSNIGLSCNEFYNNSNTYPNINNALNYLKMHYKSTKSDDKIQNKAFNRIQKYINKLPQLELNTIDSLQEQHFTNIYVSKYIGILLQKPILLSLCIQALFDFDNQFKSCKIHKKYIKSNINNIKYIPLDKIYIRIRFSRWLYAQINFYNLPKSIIQPNDSNPDILKSKILGLKLEYGLNLLYKQYLSNTCSLKVSQYFNEFIDNKEYFNNNNMIQFSLSLNDLPKNDDESWLQIKPEDVDDLLSQKQKEIDEYEKSFNSSNSNSNIPDIMNKFNKFMENESGLDGIEINNDSSSDTDSSFYSISDSEEYEDDEEIKHLMKQMDDELNGINNIANDFEKIDINGELIMDENINFMKQLFSSLEEQPGTANALSNLLKQLK